MFREDPRTVEAYENLAEMLIRGWAAKWGVDGVNLSEEIQQLRENFRDIQLTSAMAAFYTAVETLRKNPHDMRLSRIILEKLAEEVLDELCNRHPEKERLTLEKLKAMGDRVFGRE